MSAVWLLIGGTGAIFAAIVLGLVAAGVLQGQKSGVGRSLEVMEAFTAAPGSMRSEVEPGFHDRVMIPVLRSANKLGRRLTPVDHNERMRLKLDAAGNPPGWNAERITSAKGVGFVVGLIIAVLITLSYGLTIAVAIVVGVVASLAGYYAIDLWLRGKASARAELMRNGLADSIDLLTISVEAGLGFDAALAHVAKNTEGPLANEFARVLHQMQLGMGRSEALRALGERSNLEALRSFTSAMIQADSFGIPVGKVLRIQSGEMRVKRRQHAEEKASKVPVMMMMPLMFFILPTLFIVVLGPAIISMIDNMAGM